MHVAHLSQTASRPSAWIGLTLLLLMLWLSRIANLEALPLHNDEGLHLSRAVQVWNLNPFWEIRDGKIINHLWIAVFYPQHASVFVGRIATVFIATLGAAAAAAFARRLSGRTNDWIALLLWGTAPLLFFYDRMAFSDVEAGAFGTAALWAALVLVRRGGALLTGLLLALALLFKFTAAPFVLSVALVVLLSNQSWRIKLSSIVIIIGVIGAAFALPIAVLLSRGDDLFSIALAWVGSSGGGGGLTAWENVQRVISLLFWPDLPLWGVLFSVGLLSALILGNREQRVILIACLLPGVIIVVLGRDAQSRHFAAALPPLIGAAAAGWSALFMRGLRVRALAGALLIIPFIPFALTSYQTPSAVRYPDLMIWQYITGYASGYGLREAVNNFPQTISDIDSPIIASMYGDSCRRANFYASPNWAMQCGDAPGLLLIESALASHSTVYVLIEHPGEIGVQADALPAAAHLIAAYPRPGESIDSASVQLWRLDSIASP